MNNNVQRLEQQILRIREKKKGFLFIKNYAKFFSIVGSLASMFSLLLAIIFTIIDSNNEDKTDSQRDTTIEWFFYILAGVIIGVVLIAILRNFILKIKIRSLENKLDKLKKEGSD